MLRFVHCFIFFCAAPAVLLCVVGWGWCYGYVSVFGSSLYFVGLLGRCDLSRRSLKSHKTHQQMKPTNKQRQRNPPTNKTYITHLTMTTTAPEYYKSTNPVNPKPTNNSLYTGFILPAYFPLSLFPFFRLSIRALVILSRKPPSFKKSCSSFMSCLCSK